MPQATSIVVVDDQSNTLTFEPSRIEPQGLSVFTDYSTGVGNEHANIQIEHRRVNSDVNVSVLLRYPQVQIDSVTGASFIEAWATIGGNKTVKRPSKISNETMKAAMTLYRNILNNTLVVEVTELGKTVY